MSDEPKIDPETDKFTEWFVVDFGSKYIGTREYIIMHMAWLAAISAHAPTQEPSVPVRALEAMLSIQAEDFDGDCLAVRLRKIIRHFKEEKK